MKVLNISALVGKILVSFEGKKGHGSISFKTTNNEKYELSHQQDCCENVYVEDICGNPEDLIGTPILQAEEVSSLDPMPTGPKFKDASFTWTFYRITTMKGQVVIRFYGESNGYYSESVDFVQIN